MFPSALLMQISEEDELWRDNDNRCDNIMCPLINAREISNQ